MGLHVDQNGQWALRFESLEGAKCRSGVDWVRAEAAVGDGAQSEP
jgi:hypothetical protein